MWMCDRCQALNEDDKATCPACSTPRDAPARPLPTQAGQVPASPFVPPPDASPSTTPTIAPAAASMTAPARPDARPALVGLGVVGLLLAWLLVRLLSPARLIFVAIGIGVFLLGRYIGHGNEEFKRRSVTTTGVVTRLDTERSDGKTMFYPVVQFTPTRARPTKFRSSEGSSPASFHVGEQVKVYYDPQTPQDARLDSFWFAHGALLLEGFGLLAVFIALVGTPTRSTNG